MSSDFLPLLIFILFNFFGWIPVHLLCEYKYFYCKGGCHNCHNWRCKYFDTDFDGGFCNYDKTH